MDGYFEIISIFAEGKRLLETGCGTGSRFKKYLDMHARFTGIDISPRGIQKAKERTTDSGYLADYFVMNAEQTDFPDNSFDIVVGSGIIHHLEISKAYRELNRILKSNGHAVFIEPLRHNPIINLYRRPTPRMRTEDEHPLKIKDIKLMEDYFHKIDIEYSSFLTLLAVPFRDKGIFDSVYSILKKLDQLLFVIPFFRKFAWTALIHVNSPKK